MAVRASREEQTRDMFWWLWRGTLRVTTPQQALDAAEAACRARGIELREPVRVSRRLGLRPAWVVRGMATSRPGGPHVTLDAVTGEVLTVLVLPR